MRKPLLRLLLTAALVVAAMPVSAGTDHDTAEALMRKSGLWEQLAGIPAQVRSGFVSTLSSAGGKPDAADVERLDRMIDGAFAVDRLRQSALAEIQQNTKFEHLDAINSWYDSGPGIEIARAEENAARDRRDTKAVVKDGTSVLAGASPGRAALLHEIVVATRSAESTANTSINLALAIRRGVAAANPGTPGPSEDEVRGQLEAKRAEMQEAYTAITLAAMAAAYRSIPDDSLSRYVAFLKSAAGVHFNDVGTRALDAALAGAATRLGREMGESQRGATT